MGHNKSFLLKLRESAAKYWLARQEDIASSHPQAAEDLLEAIQKHHSTVVPFLPPEKRQPLNEDARPSRTLTPAFDKKIAEENQKLSQEVLDILRKPLEKNKKR